MRSHFDGLIVLIFSVNKCSPAGFLVERYRGGIALSHGAVEIGDETVARGVEDPTAIRGDEPIDNYPVSRERAKGADLIEPHQAAVAFDIRCEDRRELPFYPVGFQGSTPPRSSIRRPHARSEGL
jgi:hypothetical protein